METLEIHASTALNSKNQNTEENSRAFWMNGAEYFSVPMKLSNNRSEISAETHGLWEKEGRKWTLCLTTADKVGYSLSVIFSGLYLPLHSKLSIISLDKDGIEMDEFVMTARDNGWLVSTPILQGSALHLTYSSFGIESELKKSRKLPKIIISAVLRGLKPMPSFISGTRAPSRKQKPQISLAGSSSGLAQSEVKQSELPMGVNSEPNVQPSNSLDDQPDISEILASRISLLSGAGLECLENAGCVPEFENATRATVTLLLNSPLGGRFCTGTLINGPNPSEVLIITANHCRGTDDDLSISILWSVIVGMSFWKILQKR